MGGKRKLKVPVYIQILIAIVLGVGAGLLGIEMQWSEEYRFYIKPWGSIFVNLLKLIAIPLVLASLIVGVAGLRDLGKLKRIGSRTFGLYLITTITAISMGLLVANVFAPGKDFPSDKREELQQKYADESEKKEATVTERESQGPLQFLVDIVPENIVVASSDNRNMLQVIFFALLLGIAIAVLPEEKGTAVLGFFQSLNDVILKVVDFVMYMAPLGVFALMSSILVETAGDNPAAVWEILRSLAIYSLAVIAGLAAMVLGVYPLLLLVFAKGFSPVKFYKGILPAQLLAFSSSSSAAALPVSLERAQEHLGISKEVSGFVLPLGATVNMDGTSLYQAVATIFIANAYGIDLTFADQLTVILTATLASIGAAAVPGAGLVMLIMVLNSVGIPAEGIGLVMAVDRILDMMRTSINVTSDLTVATVIAAHEKQIDPVSAEESLERE